MEQLEKDIFYMRRCLQLAANGLLLARPNPMVGAVIVAGDGRIIGEGYHVRCGQGHAEVKRPHAALRRPYNKERSEEGCSRMYRPVRQGAGTGRAEAARRWHRSDRRRAGT